MWGLLAGGLRFIPYVGAALAAVLPTLIAFAIAPGWLQPFLVLGWIIGSDIVIGQIVEPLLFGESTGITPLALILSAIFWGTLWGPIGLLLSTPLTICLLVLGTHVPHLGFLQILLGAAPALAPYQQIYHRLIRKAVADASAVALAEIEEKGREQGLDDGMGRMVVLAEADRAQDRLSAAQIEAIVEGTDEVLEVIAEDALDGDLPAPITAEAAARDTHVLFNCVGGRGQIDDAAASVVAFALRQAGLEAVSTAPRRQSCGGGARRSGRNPPYLLRLASVGIGAALHAAQAHRHAAMGGPFAISSSTTTWRPRRRRLIAGAAGPHDCFVGDLAALCRLAAQYAVALAAPVVAQASTGT